MNILVTGGAGFIGSHLVDKLIEEGYLVSIVDNLVTGKEKFINPNASFFNLDICSEDLKKVFLKGFDCVIHLAAQIKVEKSLEDPINDAKINILGTLNLLENCRNYGVKKIIYATSAAEVGHPQYFPIDEKHKVNPLSPYGISKHTAEHYLKIYFQLYGLKYTVLRYSNVYGPRQNCSGEGGVVAIFADSLSKNKETIIFGDGKQSRDFVYVEDVVHANILALENGDNQSFNIGFGEEISIKDLLLEMQKVMGIKKEIVFSEERKGEIKRCLFDISKAKSELEWKPRICLNEGLKKTIDYYQTSSLQ